MVSLYSPAGFGAIHRHQRRECVGTFAYLPEAAPFKPCLSLALPQRCSGRVFAHVCVRTGQGEGSCSPAHRNDRAGLGRILLNMRFHLRLDRCVAMRCRYEATKLTCSITRRRAAAVATEHSHATMLTVLI
jgi:hypothetical protein